MNKPNELEFAHLLNWLEGRLPEEEAQAVAEKLAAVSGDTQADLEWLRSFLELSGSTHLVSPPSHVRASLKRRFKEHIRRDSAPSFFQTLIASLTFDSRGGFAAAGIRSSAREGRQRQLIYETEVAEIALNIQPRPRDQRVNLIGQIFPKGDIPPGEFSIQLVDDREQTQFGLTASDDLGEFAVEALPQGRYKVFLNTEGYEIELPEVQLQL